MGTKLEKWCVVVISVFAACSTPTPEVTDDDGLERVAIDVRTDELVVPPIGLCPGSPPPACACPSGRRICANNRWGPCVYPAEKCNGVDDDCDGQVDEGGDSLCNDGVSCTTNERCLTLWTTLPGGVRIPTTTCNASLNHARCDDSTSCTVDRCAPSSADADDAGCTHAPTDSLCSDGCDCTGKEVCAPNQAGSNPQTGCRGGSAPCERDGNVCTLNTCCENMTAACRATLGANAPLVEAFCAVASGPSVVSGTGATVICPPQFETLECGDDGNPCTIEAVCHPTLGCRRSNRPDGTVLDSRESGCVLTVCYGGQPRVLNMTPEQVATGHYPIPTCGNGSGTCADSSCRAGPSGFSCQSNRTLCLDSSFCNGVEVCSGTNSPPILLSDGGWSLPGCVRSPVCTDNDACTRDSCTEGVSSPCSHTYDTSIPGCDLH